ncbi:MAG: 3-alpha,7-alpha,12-alpha-trihydroxy-5-beta-cholest-24-enoyl-CoA hydratase [Pseudomonadota bacterium]
MALDYERLMAWSFPEVTRDYCVNEAIAFARGFGAGTGGQMAQADRPYLRPGTPLAMPMIAVPLCDGDFWQQHPATGIDWRQIIHAEEALTMHAALPAAGTVRITQRIVDIFDRGEGKGAVMLQEQSVCDIEGTPLATIDVTTILRGNGGFGGKPYLANRLLMPAERAPDAVLDLYSAVEADAMFKLSADIVAAAGAPSGKSMMRGVGCFGTAGRALLALVCDNQPDRLKKLAVRYTGPMFTGEALRVEMWRTVPGRALFRMLALERGNAPVLDNCFVDFSETA